MNQHCHLPVKIREISLRLLRLALYIGRQALDAPPESHFAELPVLLDRHAVVLNTGGTVGIQT